MFVSWEKSINGNNQKDFLHHDIAKDNLANDESMNLLRTLFPKLEILLLN